VDKVAAVVITRNRPAQCGDTVRSLLETAGYPIAELVVVDSSDEPVALAVPHQYLWTPPMGPGRAKNDGVQALKGAPDYLYFSDDDLGYKPDWLAALVQVMQRLPRVGVVGAAWAHHVSHHYITEESVSPELLFVERSNQPAMTMLVRWACWKSAGPFVTNNRRLGADDTAFVRTAIGRGWRVGHILPERAEHRNPPHWAAIPSMAGGGVP
jgi:glycosyltransferase involved in cell wall biosynthesis